MSANILPVPRARHPGTQERGPTVDRLVELRRALHGMVCEVARLRRDNAALRREIARLEGELGSPGHTD